MLAADALTAISGWIDLTPTRRADLTSAVKKLVKSSGLPATTCRLSADSARTFLTQSAEAMRVSEARRRNLKSLLGAVMVRLGLVEPPPTEMSLAWTDLLTRLPPRQRPGFVTFAKFCSTRQIAPDAVTAAALDSYQDHLTHNFVNRKPTKVISRLRLAWNRAVKGVAGWPGQLLPVRRNANQYTLPLEAFPDTFRADLETFCTHLGGETILDGSIWDDEEADARPINPRPLRPISVAMRRDHCRWAGSALVATGVPVAAITDLTSLVSDLHPPRIVDFLMQRAGGKPCAASMHVADVLLMIARYHVGLPDVELQKFRRLRRKAQVKYDQMTQKNERTIAKAQVPEVDEKLLVMPRALMQAAEERLADSPREAASLALRALAIGFLQQIPIRLKNLCALHLIDNLHRADPRHGLITHVLIDRSQMKVEKPYGRPITQELAKLLEVWIRLYRPHIAAPECLYLLPGSGTGDRPITPQALREAIANATERFAGVRMTPHQFRHLSVHRFLDAFPGQYEAAAEFIGHSDPRTTRRAYRSKSVEQTVERFYGAVLERKHRKGR